MVGEHIVRYRLRLAALTGMLAGLFAPPMALAQAPNVANPVAIHVLSTRPDLVSGGSALAEVTVPAAAAPSSPAVDRNGVDVSGLLPPPAHAKIDGRRPGLPLLPDTAT